MHLRSSGQLLVQCLQACTEASYLEFRKEQLSLRAEAKALPEPKDTSTHTSIESADWAASLRSSAPATTTNVPQPKEATTPSVPVSPPEVRFCLRPLSVVHPLQILGAVWHMLLERILGRIQ